MKFIKKDHYERMKRLGLLVVPVGVETAEDEILRDTDKEVTLADVRHTLKMLREVGLPVLSNFIVGHRLDTAETVRKIVPLSLETLPHFLQVSVLIPLPGTPLYDLVPKDRKRFYLRPWDFPSINQRGFVKSKGEYEHECATIRVQYYSSLRYLWHNCVRWFLRDPGDECARNGAKAALFMWRTYFPKYLAGMVERVKMLRPLLRLVRRTLRGASA